MFTILTTKEQDIEQLKKWCKDQALDFDALIPGLPFSMILRINDRISGLVAYRIIEEEACQLTFLYVDPQVRLQAYGDTLVRSLMNLLDRRGFKALYAKKEELLSPFYEKFGFEDDQKDSSRYVIPSIDAFFKKPCKGNKG